MFRGVPFVKHIQSRSWMPTPACFNESLMTECIHCLWCLAVSCGKKPSPGGVMYVCLTFDKTVVDPSGSCLMIPAPSLLAEPSRPSAIYGHSNGDNQASSFCQSREIAPGRLSGDLLREPGIVGSWRRRVCLATASGTNKRLSATLSRRLAQGHLSLVRTHPVRMLLLNTSLLSPMLTLD